MSKTYTLRLKKKYSFRKIKILNFKSQFFGKLSLKIFRLSLQIRVILVFKFVFKYYNHLKEAINLLYSLKPNFWNFHSKCLGVVFEVHFEKSDINGKQHLCSVIIIKNVSKHTTDTSNSRNTLNMY